MTDFIRCEFKIRHYLWEETDTKIADADRSDAAAIADLKSRGETVASITQLTSLTTVEVDTLLRSTKPKQKSEKSPADKTASKENSSSTSAST